MVAKMRYIHLTGHTAAMNHAVTGYLARFDIQLDAARGDSETMKPFTTLNPYAQTLRKAEFFAEIVGPPPVLQSPLGAAEAVNLVEEAQAAWDERGAEQRRLEEELAQTRREAESLACFAGLDVDLGAFAEVKYLHFRFGKLPAEQYKRFSAFLAGDERVYFHSARRDGETVYGLYITPPKAKERTDALFASLDFVPIQLPLVEGTPSEGLERAAERAAELEEETKRLGAVLLGQPDLATACAKVQELYAAFDVRKYATVSKGRRIFTFSGWMAAEDAARLEREAAADDLVIFTHEEARENAPTLLRNWPVVRQFEFFTRLYGLPAGSDIDPTPLIAVTYTFLFGLMFGDVGHGLVLAFLGLFIQRRKHADLGGIMMVVGLSAAAFGVLYGSAFGLEWSPLWRRPAENINETLLFAAGLGAGLIVLSMLVNMYTCLRRGHVRELLFGANGVAGLMFYSAVIWLAWRVIFQGLPVTLPVIALAVLPLALIAATHPPGQMFEVILTYCTNTISFIRVGAFAISHAGMMHVVLTMSRGAAGGISGAGGWAIFILGNVLVMVIEGLLIGIQVLRLDFYEIMSRFYRGGGSKFETTMKGVGAK